MFCRHSDTPLVCSLSPIPLPKPDDKKIKGQVTTLELPTPSENPKPLGEARVPLNGNEEDPSKTLPIEKENTALSSTSLRGSQAHLGGDEAPLNESLSPTGLCARAASLPQATRGNSAG